MEKVKDFLFTHHVIIHIRDTKGPPKILRSDKQLQQFSGYNINTQNKLCFNIPISKSTY